MWQQLSADKPNITEYRYNFVIFQHMMISVQNSGMEAAGDV